MTDLLARLRSPSIIKSSREMTPAKLEALDHAYEGEPVTIKRARGEDPLPAWEILHELVETGLMRDEGPRVVDGIRHYDFFITAEGRSQVRASGRRTG